MGPPVVGRNLSVAVAILFLAAGRPAWAQFSERLSVSLVDDTYSLTVGVSRLELLVPKGDLVQLPARVGGSTDSPRYFQLGDLKHGLIISGWFESSNSYRGMDRYWEEQLAAWKDRNLPTPTNVSIERVGNWDAVFYQLLVSAGSSTHIRAHLIQAGTWIDVHVSVTTQNSAASNRLLAEALLRSLVVREKPYG